MLFRSDLRAGLDGEAGLRCDEHCSGGGGRCDDDCVLLEESNVGIIEPPAAQMPVSSLAQQT